MFDPKVEEALQDLTDKLEAQAPDLANILRVGREEGTAPHLLMGQVLHMLLSRPELAGILEDVALESFAPLREDTSLEPVEPMEGIPAMMEPEVGLPKLNPLYAAALAEKVQFDGDVPECRTGPMVEGMTPAVPVDTVARNPVVVGDMLKRASQDVAENQRALRDEVAVLLANPDAAEVVYREAAQQIALQEDQKALQILESSVVELDGYRRGAVPALREVAAPTGAQLARFTPEEAAEAAWKALSTTQGRRTALRALREMVQGDLMDSGLDVQVSTDPPRRGAEVLAHTTWSVDISGEKTLQANFSYVDTAAGALARGLRDEYAGCLPVLLEITTVDTVDVRRVGWAARLVSREITG